MFFSRKKSVALDLGWLNADMHSHLVPGVDDGSPNVDTSMQMIRGLLNFGYQKLITTPHILWEVYPNTSGTISGGLEKVRTALSAEKVDVEMHGAAEYFIDEYFEGLLEKKAPLLTISGNMVLVEFSMITAPMDLQRVLFEMQMQDYQPVIAHPERYIYLMRKKSFFDDLKNAGCLFQLNLLSLAGAYGTTSVELAEYLAKMDYYDLAGTDLHNLKQLEMMKKLGGSPLLKRLKDSGRLINHKL
jgi:tyrosine-protein phosphatase YwqE